MAPRAPRILDAARLTHINPTASAPMCRFLAAPAIARMQTIRIIICINSMTSNLTQALPLRAVRLRHLAHPARLSPVAQAVALGLALGAMLLPQGAGAQEAAAKAPEEKTLPAVKVTASPVAPALELPLPHAGGQVAKGARLGALGNQDVMDTPFNITSYTSELIENQQAKTIADVLNNDPSVRFTTSGSHAYENFRLRGFDVHSSELAINGLYGLAPLGHTTLEFVERVEVLKGPSALFTGMAPNGGVGGVINLVPKRAGDAPLTRVSVGYQSDSQLSTSVDAGRRFGEDNAFGVRVNGSYSDGDTALDGQSKRNEFVSAALDYRGKGLKASLDVYSSQATFKGGSPAMYGFASTNIPDAPDPSTNILKPAYGTLKNQAVIASAEYEFNRHLSAFGSFGTRKHDYEGWINGTHAHNVQANGNAQARTVAQRGYEDGTTTEAGLRARFSTGLLRHELVAQLSQQEREWGSLTNVTGMQATNIYNPSNLVMASLPTGVIPKTNDATLTSLALVDTLSFLDEAVRLTLGLRQQQVEQTTFNTTTGAVSGTPYDKKALTPSVAVVVKPWGDDVSLYGSYVQGLSQGGQVTDTLATNYGQVFAPYKTTQREVGVKWALGSFTNTASLFEINQPTMMSTGPSSNPTYTDGAETRVRGLEWNTFGLVLPSVKLLGGVSYTKSKLTKTQGGVSQGNEVFGVPRWQGNLGAEWDLPWVAGLSLSGRVITTSSQYLNNANTYKIPSWSQFDAGAAYRTSLAAKPLVLRLNVANLFDKHYWSGSFAEPRATLAQGRTVTASATMDF